ncbi:IS21 family transposase [Halomonas campisalis]|uniref:IS21 family transposase n=1 Tax=Billgrantia campisalis TaxID=74661 RepID=A0ABS9PDS9_9GAMM|nr:IS21 family transposase [Halomonas campisalis]MCG6659914.1 IS21 family transposase [Halomonas campisalis]MDR5865127.1 IS21 family transposase [Halomonas campisalis]
MAVTSQQVTLYMSQRQQGQTQPVAAAKAGLSVSTARRLERRAESPEPSAPRHWRTRPDPFAEVWDGVVVPQLAAAPNLQALTLLEWLQEQYPGQYPDSLLRTLQRRVKGWRAAHGPDKEVMFPQTHGPGLRGLSDFTELKGIAITIAGKPLDHRLYHFRLAFSGWCYVRVVLGGESYPALAEGLTSALERLGGVPAEHRTDSLSAAFRNLGREAETDLTERYEALCAHYGMTATRNNRGRGHENASIESPHGHFKRRLTQRLALRGSQDFTSLDDYQAFLDEVATAINRRNAARITVERGALQPLPSRPGTDYGELTVRVTSSSTIQVRKVLYSVPSRLIGERLRVHLYDDRLVLHHAQQVLLTLPRLHATPESGRLRAIDYRHVIGWLVRKPRALAGLTFRDELLPGADWRELYARLASEWPVAEACKRIVGALALAAEQDQAEAIATYWLGALQRGENPSLAELQARFAATPSKTVPFPQVTQHEIASYDVLIPATPATEVRCHA